LSVLGGYPRRTGCEIVHRRQSALLEMKVKVL
jgi:hypothetical protein